MKKALPLIATCILAASVAACSHQNPLTNPDKHKVGTFLVSASRYSEQQMRLGNELPGTVYADCMAGNAQTDCSVLYDNMVAYAKHQPDFQDLTVKDLTDFALWHTNEDAYVKAAFNQL